MPRSLFSQHQRIDIPGEIGERQKNDHGQQGNGPHELHVHDLQIPQEPPHDGMKPLGCAL